MKKISIIILTSLAVCLSAHAQSMYDAYTFSENNYMGTAKSVGLANAVTALGGDLEHARGIRQEQSAAHEGSRREEEELLGPLVLIHSEREES